MTQPFLGQIQPFGFTFAPLHWAQCNGQIMAIQQNTALFALLGTLYGGNGTTTFALPDLQSRVPVHAGPFPGGPTFFQGEADGVETVTITIGTMPAHNHAFVGASADADAAVAGAGQILAKGANPNKTPDNFYGPDTTPQPLNMLSVFPLGGNQAHTNIQPYQAINWCIALAGIFPTRP